MVTNRSCICQSLKACERRVRAVGGKEFSEGFNAALERAQEAIEAITEDQNSSVEWDRDYDIDPSGEVRNPRIWIREAIHAIDGLVSNRSAVVCHYCQRPVYFSTDAKDPLHLDHSPLCSQGNVVRWIERDPYG